MNLSEEDLREIYGDIETVILAGSTATNQKKVRHDYMLSEKQLENFEQIYYIAAAQIRQGIEKVFEKYLDKDLVQKAAEEAQKRKRGPRKKIEKEVSTSQPVSTGQIGKFKVKSFG